MTKNIIPYIEINKLFITIDEEREEVEESKII
jgi:hypothetical protein